MKRISLFAITLFAVGLSSALAQDVRYNFDKTADFSKFKTYKWVEIKGSDQVNSIIDGQIKAAVEEQLAAKGLTRVDTDDANLYIGYQTAVGQEKQFNSYSTGWGYGPGWGGGWYGGYGGMSSTTTSGSTSTIYVGQLALDMYDSQNKDLVWRGVASKTLNTKAKPDKVEKNIKKAVAKLLKKYPPTQS